MKKLFVCAGILIISAASTVLYGHTCEKTYQPWSTAFTAGYVFKHDCRFKEVYGHGVVNAITGDICYNPWKQVGFGVKGSFWRAKGKTTFLQQCTLLDQVPFTIYARAIKRFRCGLQCYGSFGGGFVWTKERSYVGCVHPTKGIGEVELGLNYIICRHFGLTSAVRYLFPPQHHGGERIDVGGCDLRAGIIFEF